MSKPKRKPRKAKSVAESYAEDVGKMMRDKVNQLADDWGDTEMLVADGFDPAIVGVTEGPSPVVVYDFDECVNVLIFRDGMTEEDALEHMSFNVTGAYVGDRTPIFIKLL